MAKPLDKADLRDPLAQLLDDMRTNPEDAAVIAQFLDIGVLTKLFREKGYGAQKKIQVLLEIIDSGKPTERMRAMDMLDKIWEQSLVRRGMLVGGGGATLPGGMNPIGLPQPARRVESVEMTSQSVRMVLGEMDEPPADHTAPQPRALQESEHDSESEEDPEYFRDERDEQCNIARLPSGG